MYTSCRSAREHSKSSFVCKVAGGVSRKTNIDYGRRPHASCRANYLCTIFCRHARAYTTIVRDTYIRVVHIQVMYTLASSSGSANGSATVEKRRGSAPCRYIRPLNKPGSTTLFSAVQEQAWPQFTC